LKKYVLAYVAVVACALIGFLLLANSNPHSNVEVDTVAINEMVHQVTRNWGNLELLDTENFPYSFFILDSDGEHIQSTAQGLPGSAISAIRIGFLPMSIVVNEQILGTVLFETSAASANHASLRVNSQVIFAFILLCALNAAFMMILYMAIVKPFRRIQRFAHNISLGILDESLPIHKNNLFGLFTQSFDIMRESLQDARQKQHKAERQHQRVNSVP